MSDRDLFLSEDELTELTGFKSASGHMRWLDRNRWKYVTTCHRKPRVLRAYFEDRMGLPSPAAAAGQLAQAAANLAQPNFSALTRR